MNQATHMAGLVDNALDFLDQAFNELQTSPKYSVIHFYAAVELFLKARLLAEHWSLVIAKPQEADHVKFLKGDFQSVTLDDAAKRLEKIVGSGLTVAEVQQVQRLGRHRNQMMHFYQDFQGKSGEALRQEIAVEQLRVWRTLHHLLLEKWGEVFKPWADRIYELEIPLRGHRDYLQARYDALKPELAAREQAGARLAVCVSCQHRASQLFSVLGLLDSNECQVCGLPSLQIEANCPGCGHAMTFLDDGFQTCEKCGREVEPAELAKIIDEDEPGTKAYYEQGMPGHCMLCSSRRTVVHHGGECLCAACFTIFHEEDMGSCGWCGAVNAGDLEDSVMNGCTVCDGRLGRD